MLDIVRVLLENWEKANVVYCHWKSNEHLEAALLGDTDLDVLVSKKCQRSCAEVLVDSGYVKLKIQVGAKYEDVEEWLGFDEKTGRFIHVHLHYKMITGKKHVKEYEFPFEELALDTRVKEKNGVYVIDPHIEICILYMRIVLKAPSYDKVFIDSNYQKEISYLKEKIVPERLEEVCSIIFENDKDFVINQILNDYVTTEQWKIFLQIIDKRFGANKRYSSLAAKNKSFFHKNLLQAKKVINRHQIFTPIVTKKTIPGIKGISICFVGCDGCGKSTLSRDIKAWLNWKLDSRIFYLGSGDHYHGLLKRIASRAVKSNSSSASDENTSTDLKKITFKGKIKRIFGALMILQNEKYKLKTLKQSNKYIEKGGISIYDRFPQSQFEGIYDGPKINNKYSMYFDQIPILKKLAKKESDILEQCGMYSPTLVFKLHIPIDVAMLRKPDHNRQEIENKINITEQLQFDDSSLVLDVDATQHYEEEKLEIKKKIWQLIKN